jgi:hypothetical protein
MADVVERRDKQLEEVLDRQGLLEERFDMLLELLNRTSLLPKAAPSRPLVTVAVQHAYRAIEQARTFRAAGPAPF